MNTTKRIYLDHAATSWPKPESVLSAMDHFHRHEGAAAGRGSYAAGIRASLIVAECRRRIADLIGAVSVDCVSFHHNGTAALNAAIQGIVRAGDHVVTTAAEHNSVLRPLTHLQHDRDVELSIVPCDDSGLVDADDVLNAVRPETRMVAVTHVSNVTGRTQPIEEIGYALKERHVAFLCDAAQSFGYFPFNANQMNVDLLAAPGHKGGRGPLGTAMLYCDPKWHDAVCPIVQGGTGSRSESLLMPESMPQKLEAGNLNVPAIAGWNAGLADLTESETNATKSRLFELSGKLYRQLSTIPQVDVVGSADIVPIVSLMIRGVSPSDVSAILDGEYSIEARAGLHCAPLIHQYIGSAQEGTLRISAGRDTTDEEIDSLVRAIKEIASEINH